MPEETPVIKHIVVLMMENRSFDHMLGFWKAQNPLIEGLTGKESIPDDPTLDLLGGSGETTVFPITKFDGYVTYPDAGHEFDNVNVQLFGSHATPDPPLPKNNGFILNYSQSKDTNDVPIGVVAGERIMGCFDTSTQLPVMAFLAQNFVVCDHWFSSVPGPTWPNRFFAHAATSNGHVDSPSSLETIKDIMGFSTYGMRTIYENLADNNLTWKIYHHDIPQSLALTNLHDSLNNFVDFSRFAADVASGDLPSYSFIEPRYFNAPGVKANDQHPPHDVQEGEQLTASVYKALRSNDAIWKNCLFVLLYDEAGGFYDHLPPPTAINPDGKVSSDPPFGFDRLGVRVPALLISPFVGKGRVDHTVYDHTSLLATVKKLFNLPTFLTKRDAAANTFESNLNVANCAIQRAAEKDFPQKDLSPMAAALAYSAEKLSPFQDSLVKLANVVNRPSFIKTEHDASAHVIEQLAQFKG